MFLVMFLPYFTAKRGKGMLKARQKHGKGTAKAYQKRCNQKRCNSMAKTWQQHRKTMAKGMAKSTAQGVPKVCPRTVTKSMPTAC